MTSQSLRKHRITRWNILRTSSVDLVRVAGLCALLVVIPSDQLCARGEEKASAEAAATSASTEPKPTSGTTDSVFLQKLIQINAVSTDTGKASSEKNFAGRATLPNATTSKQTSTAKPNEMLKMTQAMIDNLRLEQSASRPPDSSTELHLNDIFLTTGQDLDTSGVTSIPNVMEGDFELQAVPGTEAGDIEQTGRKRKMALAAQAAEGCVTSKKQAKKNSKNLTSKARGGIRSLQGKVTRLTGGLIEFYDPSVEECYDTDDYHMPILLVSAHSEPADGEEDNYAKAEDVETQQYESPARTGVLSRKLTDIKPTLSYAWGDKPQTLPDDFFRNMDHGVYEQIPADRVVVQWAPTNLWYHPLYFQDPALERYGHSRHHLVQPFVSSGRFFTQVIGLPYQMVLNPPTSRDYALGYYQPGDWAPKKKYQIPFNEEAATIEFVWIAGLILLIP